MSNDNETNEEVRNETKQITVNSKKELAPTDHFQLMNLIDRLIQAQSVPRHLKNRLQVLSAWNFAAQLGLPPQPSLKNIAVIEGNPQLFGDLPLALAQAHPDFISINEFCIDEKYNEISLENQNLSTEPWGGVCEIWRKGMKKPEVYHFTKIDADRAGLLKRAKSGMPWQSYPQIMFVRRARSIALKTHFADALNGAAISEHDYNLAPDLVDITPLNPTPEDTVSFIDSLD